MTKYTPEVIEYLKKNSDTPLKKQLKELKEKFGLDITYLALSCIRAKYGIKRSYIFFNTEVLDFLKKNADLRIDEQVELIKKQFGVEVSNKQIAVARMYYGIKRSVHFNSIFPKPVQDFIKENRYVYKNKEMAEAVNKTFGTSYTHMQIACFRRENNIVYSLFTSEMGDFIVQHKNESNAEITEKLNRTFGTDYTMIQVRGYISQRKIRGVQRSFRPYKHKEFDERKKNSGNSRWEVLVNGRWIPKSRYVYEKATGEKVEEGKICVFLDGNIENFSLDNMIFVNRRLLGFVNNYLKGTCKNNGELTKFKYDIAELKLLITEKQRKLNEKAVKK